MHRRPHTQRRRHGHPERRRTDEHRARGRDATTLTGLTVEIDQLRRSIETLAARVRRHEEQLRQIERAHRQISR